MAKKKELNDFNILSKESYDMESGKIQVGNTVGKDKYLVLDAINTNKDTLKNEKIPKNNSMQAMTVAEIKDEFKSYKASKLKEIEGYPESVIKKDLIILYAGTNSWQDFKTDVREIGLNDKHQNGAFQSALAYAKEIEKKYSMKEGYKISTAGHSLGGAQAIYVAVLMGYNAFTYGAAGAGLTDEQIREYHGQIVNFYTKSDIVTSGLVTGGKDRIPFYSFGIENGNNLKEWIDENYGHGLNLFQIDAFGNYIDKYGDIAIFSDGHGGIALEQTLLAQQILENKNKIRGLETYDGASPYSLTEIKRLKKENKWLQEQIKQFKILNELRVVFLKNGSGMSSSERIYLEDRQALVVVKLASAKFDLAMEESIAIYKKAISELIDDWEAGKRLIQQQTPDLSYAEMMEAMERVRYTKKTMVDSDAQHFQDKISKANRIKGEFAQLTREITNKIHELVQRDQELADQIKGALT
ncbi:MAG: triacylglycerol lipase [Enterococcus lacertideformus]|uniref:Triacylglycerol lipase n=1 Tax=Enterococcus lacertideformus TaxID=2771493 RepID=A0A931FAZ5_9ENTE|nr:triacylglycerol lipase [Enterococcus lacertideformus]